MALQCLLLTQDHNLLDLMRPSLQGYGIECEVRNEWQSAAEVCARRHLDGFILDCDDVPGGIGLIEEIRNGRSNKQSTIVAVLNGKTTFPEALERGANFVLSKPIGKDHLSSYLKVARVFMEREHRRYFRYSVDLPLKLETTDQINFNGKMINVSEGGMLLRVLRPTNVNGTVRLSFDLPTITPHRIQMKGEIVWADKEGQLGVRFHFVPDDARVDFLDWLSMLESQGALHAGNPCLTLDQAPN